MERPRKHIIQTISNKAFANIIPHEWAARELDQDYGLDFMLEIFVNQESTGKLFFVQLKGTDDPPKDNTITYQIKRAHLDYYNSIPNPILFVIYSIPTKTFWGVWTNNLKNFLEKKRDNQKSSLLRLSKDQIIDNTYFEDLPTYFSPDLPDKFVFSSTTDTELAKAFNQKLIEWVEHYFPKAIVKDSSQLIQRINLTYNTLESKHLSISINHSLESSNYLIKDIHTCRYIYLPFTDFRHIDKTLTIPLIHLAITLSDKDIEGSALLIIKCLEGENPISFSPENLISIGTKIIRSGKFNILQKLIEAFIEAKMFDEFQFLNLMLLESSEEEYISLFYQKNLINVIPQITNKKLKGTLNYNLANSYFYSGDYYSASRCYQSARKNQPEYLEKAYWWFEYAGILFLTKHFQYAEKYYKKSKELGIESSHGNIVWALIGNSLFFQGKFNEAKIFFQRYMETSQSIPDEYFLKYDVCRNMVMAELDGIKLDIEVSHILVEKALMEEDENKLLEAIRKNPLNAVAWFNCGVSLDKEQKPKLAFMAYLTAGSIAEWDIEAWKNCFLISWNLKHIEKTLIFYKIILKRFGSRSLNYLADHILDDPNIEHENKVMLIKGFKQVAEELEKNSGNNK